MKGDAAGKVLYCPFLNYQGINNLRRRAHIVSVGHLREGLLQTGFPFPLTRSHWLCLSDSDLYPRVMQNSRFAALLSPFHIPHTCPQPSKTHSLNSYHTHSPGRPLVKLFHILTCQRGLLSCAMRLTPQAEIYSFSHATKAGREDQAHSGAGFSALQFDHKASQTIS